MITKEVKTQVITDNATHEGDTVQTLKCVGDGKVEDIVWVENDHIRRK